MEGMSVSLSRRAPREWPYPTKRKGSTPRSGLNLAYDQFLLEKIQISPITNVYKISLVNLSRIIL